MNTLMLSVVPLVFAAAAFAQECPRFPELPNGLCSNWERSIFVECQMRVDFEPPTGAEILSASASAAGPVLARTWIQPTDGCTTKSQFGYYSTGNSSANLLTTELHRSVDTAWETRPEDPDHQHTCDFADGYLWASSGWHVDATHPTSNSWDLRIEAAAFVQNAEICPQHGAECWQARASASPFAVYTYTYSGGGASYLHWDASTGTWIEVEVDQIHYLLFFGGLNVSIGSGSSPLTTPSWVVGMSKGAVGYQTLGMTMDQQEESFAAGGTVSMTTGDVLSAFSISYKPDDMDVNHDGRFNEFDYEALVMLDGTSETEETAYDFNDNDQYDDFDADMMVLLIDAGFENGVFGDITHDLVVDCADTQYVRALIDNNNDPFNDREYDDLYYFVQLDANLDGRLDDTDRDAFYGAVPSADFNDDGSVNTQDWLAFLSAWAASDPSADVNEDGTVNTQDTMLFLNWYNYSGGCY